MLGTVSFFNRRRWYTRLVFLRGVQRSVVSFAGGGVLEKGKFEGLSRDGKDICCVARTPFAIEINISGRTKEGIFCTF